jgi:AbrB family looped-hinge helix DNA binding protein
VDECRASDYYLNNGISVLRRIKMRETLIVSSRGQITLPADMRKQLGIAPGSAVIIETRNGELALKPAAVLEIERYTDEQIAQWDSEDKLTAAERKRILARLQKA